MTDGSLTCRESIVAHDKVGDKVRALLDVLASVKFAVGVVVVIALACILGTVLPQGAEAAGYIRRNPGAAHWIDILGRLGLTHVFTAWWFIGLLALLSATVATCSVRRIFTVRRTTGFARRRALGSMLTHISILLILAGGVVRGIWGESGYVELREGETKHEFMIENRARPLPFALHLADFEVERYNATAPKLDENCLHHELLVQWPARKLSARVPVRLNVSHSLTPMGEEPTAENTFIIRVAKYVPDFAMNSETREVMSRSEQPNNPAVLVEVNNPTYQNNCWLFAKHPDFKVFAPGHEPSGPSPLRIFYRVESHQNEHAVVAPVKSFKSAVRLFNGEKPVREATVEVNRPMKYGGYTFYQTGYDPKDPTWTSLQVVRDPGVPLVYAGFAFLIAGLFTVFYLNPWLNERSKVKLSVTKPTLPLNRAMATEGKSL
jgi:cytochrome c biogenesis protein ResB